ncbi:hypothetical protein HJ138_22685 [Vibrio parahaemolyticus]|uniref:hypothetical protein n=1 Tax=Vibrio parahaemolyticus TaxID=670 RepID=UPI0012AD6DD3|nr:hypothetical protein [Vibrio parahaemolyticus]EGR0394844.1 hypothetical protein [Vibrio vulnificus]MBE3977031.1 hypothetical protein [Vibrio parahaemolyticus]MCU8426225.1 hypothetical protein [Vibrio vulnificus]MCU8430642.1 hypothetical protein [Vibrio vulnificus]
MFDENYVMTSIAGMLVIAAWQKPHLFIEEISSRVFKVSLSLMIGFIVWGAALSSASLAISGLLDESTLELVQNAIKGKDVPESWWLFLVAVIFGNSALEWLAQKIIKQEHDKQDA